MATTWTEDHPAFRVAAARRILGREGCESRVAGHVSVRHPERHDAFWVSPFGYFSETLPGDVNCYDMDLQLLEGDTPASPAVRFHAGFYQARPDANSVIHTHSHYVEVLSTTGKDVGMYSADACLFYREQAHYADNGIDNPVDGPRMAEALGERSVVIIGNHGACFVCGSLEEATVKAIALETSARAHFEAQIVGGHEMPEAEAARAKKAYHRYFIPMMWEANYRRLRRTDADLFEALADS
ncbi:class II aldolase/adducin family protein [Candidatus Poriferisocius sp.]|uniref:class II aldolase/adducin family protein n=1 Tax=Candidatus Poriferisocius sp. TaxID=3101276 RepID=UPI003B58BF36